MTKYIKIECINPDGSCTRSGKCLTREEADRLIAYYESEGFKTKESKVYHQEIIQDVAYWASIYPDGNYPHGV